MPQPWTALRTLRERSGMSQAQLATAARMSRQYLSKIETGRVVPRPALVARLATALDVPISMLVAPV